jgi:uncharacterized protein YndB with AHSA1/START domain
MTAKANKAALAADTHEIVITRAFNAPRALVFAMWTDHEHFVHWMRPPGFATVVCEAMDARPGGKVRTRMRTADGTEFVSEWTFREIKQPSVLAYDEICTENGKLFHRARQTVSFEEHGGSTTMTLRGELELVPERDPKFDLKFMEEGWTGGWNGNLDLMAVQLQKSAAGRA